MLTETAPASGVFAGAIATRLGAATANDGVYDLGRGATLDTLTAAAGGATAEAGFEIGRLHFRTSAGHPAAAAVAGHDLIVELATRKGDPLVADTLAGAVEISAAGLAGVLETEPLTLVETGPDTGIYEVTIATGLTEPPVPADGVLRAGPGEVLVATFTDGDFRLNAELRAEANQPPPIVAHEPGRRQPVADRLFGDDGATAFDREDGNLDSAIAWSSSLDGPLGSGPSSTAALSDGYHLLTASVTDSDGAVSTASCRGAPGQQRAQCRSSPIGGEPSSSRASPLLHPEKRPTRKTATWPPRSSGCRAATASSAPARRSPPARCRSAST